MRKIVGTSLTGFKPVAGNEDVLLRLGLDAERCLFPVEKWTARDILPDGPADCRFIAVLEKLSVAVKISPIAGQ